MELNDECRACLFNSQLKKVEREQTDKTKFGQFKLEVKALCANASTESCAPLLMREIDLCHRRIFGCGIDYSKEKKAFNGALLSLEDKLFKRITAANDPIEEALKYSMAANYIDFARLSNLDESSVEIVISAAERASVDKAVLESFKSKLKTAKTLCFLHDNCGEIVLDKILIRAIKRNHPLITVNSVVRGKPIINDVTLSDAEEVGLKEFAEVLDNGTNVPGTYLKEVSPKITELLNTSPVIISKGLGNLETLYGAGYSVFYAFNCKCEHISERFGLPLWAPAFIEEGKK